MDDHTQMSDAVLWRRATAGQPDAFGQIFDRHVQAVYRHCFRLSGSADAADDLTSAVFIEAWKRGGDPPAAEDGSLLPWLLGVATIVVRSRSRSLWRYRRLLHRLPEPRPNDDLADEVADRVDAERQIQDLLVLVRHLPKHDQEVLALCGWAGLSYQDAASVLGVPVGTIRSRLSRARAKLRELTADRQEAR